MHSHWPEDLPGSSVADTNSILRQTRSSWSLLRDEWHQLKHTEGRLTWRAGQPHMTGLRGNDLNVETLFCPGYGSHRNLAAN
jgi:hypothetical protein